MVAGTTTEDNVAEAERRAAAARAQLAQIEQARRAAAEELRASQNIVEDARRRAAQDQQRAAHGGLPQSPPRSLAALEQEWRQKTPGTPSTVRKVIQLGTRPAFDSKQRDFVAFLASINLAHYAPKLRQEQIDCIADLKILNNDCLLYTSPSPRDGLLSRMPSSA